MAFGITPVAAPSPLAQAGEFVQIRSDGVDVGDRRVAVVNVISPLVATRGWGANAHVVTITRPAPAPTSAPTPSPTPAPTPAPLPACADVLLNLAGAGLEIDSSSYERSLSASGMILDDAYPLNGHDTYRRDFGAGGGPARIRCFDDFAELIGDGEACLEAWAREDPATPGAPSVTLSYFDGLNFKNDGERASFNSEGDYTYLDQSTGQGSMTLTSTWRHFALIIDNTSEPDRKVLRLFADGVQTRYSGAAVPKAASLNHAESALFSVLGDLLSTAAAIVGGPRLTRGTRLYLTNEEGQAVNGFTPHPYPFECVAPIEQTVTFSEVDLGTQSPVIGNMSFGRGFAGHSQGNIVTCDFTTSVCVLGSPSDPLTLDTALGGSQAEVVTDGAAEDNRVLCGSADFSDGLSVAVAFALPVRTVTIRVGGLNDGNVRVRMYDAAGELLNDQTSSPTTGFWEPTYTAEANLIAGVLISEVAQDDAGWGLDRIFTSRDA